MRLFTGSVVPHGRRHDPAAGGRHRATATGCASSERGAAGRHIRRAGQDFAAGDVVIPAGRRLTARDIGLAAAANHPWLTVHRRPRVAILATGDEIAMPGEPIPPGGIVSSNSHALAALVRAAGGEPLVLPVATDDRAAHRRGGRLGARDGHAGDHRRRQRRRPRPGAVRRWQARGMTLDFWQIAMRPGKPLLFGRLGEVPVLGLPGNPVSALVCAHLFLLPALSPACPACPATPPPRRRGGLGAPLPANDGRADHLRATLTHRRRRPLVATAVRAPGFGDAAPAGAGRCADSAPAARPRRCRQAADVRVIRLDSLGL